MIKITKADWEEFDKIGIDRNLVEAGECGIWFKNVGSALCVDIDKKTELMHLNTKIQASTKE